MASLPDYSTFLSSGNTLHAGPKQALRVSIATPFRSLPLFDLPPLPRVTDPNLHKLAVTRSSTHGLPRRAYELDIVQGDIVQDYEKLEHVGDGLLGQCGHSLTAHSVGSR